jgi:hypothetical protein
MTFLCVGSGRGAAMLWTCISKAPSCQQCRVPCQTLCHRHSNVKTTSLGQFNCMKNLVLRGVCPLFSFYNHWWQWRYKNVLGSSISSWKIGFLPICYLLYLPSALLSRNDMLLPCHLKPSFQKNNYFFLKLKTVYKLLSPPWMFAK